MDSSEEGASPNGVARQVPMVDLLASRSEEEEALCAVCGGGVSVAPNYIVFCERCDVAVHQACYQIEEVPPGARICLHAGLCSGL